MPCERVVPTSTLAKAEDGAEDGAEGAAAQSVQTLRATLSGWLSSAPEPLSRAVAEWDRRHEEHGARAMLALVRLETRPDDSELQAQFVKSLSELRRNKPELGGLPLLEQLGLLRAAPRVAFLPDHARHAPLAAAHWRLDTSIWAARVRWAAREPPRLGVCDALFDAQHQLKAFDADWRCALDASQLAQHIHSRAGAARGAAGAAELAAAGSGAEESAAASSAGAEEVERSAEVEAVRLELRQQRLLLDALFDALSAPEQLPEEEKQLEQAPPFRVSFERFCLFGSAVTPEFAEAAAVASPLLICSSAQANAVLQSSRNLPPPLVRKRSSFGSPFASPFGGSPADNRSQGSRRPTRELDGRRRLAELFELVHGAPASQPPDAERFDPHPSMTLDRCQFMQALVRLAIDRFGIELTPSAAVARVLELARKSYPRLIGLAGVCASSDVVEHSISRDAFRKRCCYTHATSAVLEQHAPALRDLFANFAAVAAQMPSSMATTPACTPAATPNSTPLPGRPPINPRPPSVPRPPQLPRDDERMSAYASLHRISENPRATMGGAVSPTEGETTPGRGGRLPALSPRPTELPPRLSAAGWWKMLHSVGLIDDVFCDRCAALVFAWSRLRVVDEGHRESSHRVKYLCFEDFLEALVHMAGLRALPTAAELERGDANKNAGDYVLQLMRGAEGPAAYARFLESHNPNEAETPANRREPIHVRVEHLVSLLGALTRPKEPTMAPSHRPPTLRRWGTVI